MVVESNGKFFENLKLDRRKQKQMKLIKFLVKEVQEEMNELKAYSFGDWKNKSPHKINQWNYVIQGQDGNEYYLYSYRSEKIYRNSELRCFVKERENKKFNIEYHLLYKTKCLSPLLFRKAKEDYIQRAKKGIEFWNKELQRLEAL